MSIPHPASPPINPHSSISDTSAARPLPAVPAGCASQLLSANNIISGAHHKTFQQRFLAAQNPERTLSLTTRAGSATDSEFQSPSQTQADEEDADDVLATPDWAQQGVAQASGRERITGSPVADPSFPGTSPAQPQSNHLVRWWEEPEDEQPFGFDDDDEEEDDNSEEEEFEEDGIPVTSPRQPASRPIPASMPRGPQCVPPLIPEGAFTWPFPGVEGIRISELDLDSIIFPAQTSRLHLWSIFFDTWKKRGAPRRGKLFHTYTAIAFSGP